MIVKMTAGVRTFQKRMVTYLEKNKSKENNDSPGKREGIFSIENEEEQQQQDFKIHLGGYLNTEIRQEGYKELSPQKQKDLIVEKTNGLIERFQHVIPKKGTPIRRFVMSPSPVLMNKLDKSNQEKLLKDVVQTAMKNFKDNFYKGDQIGYVYSIHKDTKNMHAHVYIFCFVLPWYLVSITMCLLVYWEPTQARYQKEQGYLKMTRPRFLTLMHLSLTKHQLEPFM